MIGFVGMQTFAFFLNLCKHSQNLNLAYSDILIGSFFVLGFVYVCLVGPDKLVWTFGQGKLVVLQFTLLIGV